MREHIKMNSINVYIEKNLKTDPYRSRSVDVIQTIVRNESIDINSLTSSITNINLKSNRSATIRRIRARACGDSREGTHINCERGELVGRIASGTDCSLTHIRHITITSSKIVAA